MTWLLLFLVFFPAAVLILTPTLIIALAIVYLSWVKMLSLLPGAVGRWAKEKME